MAKDANVFCQASFWGPKWFPPIAVGSLCLSLYLDMPILPIMPSLWIFWVFALLCCCIFLMGPWAQSGYFWFVNSFLYVFCGRMKADISYCTILLTSLEISMALHLSFHFVHYERLGSLLLFRISSLICYCEKRAFGINSFSLLLNTWDCLGRLESETLCSMLNCNWIL